jgi:hypothetical protein
MTAFITPRTWIHGESVDETLLNTALRNQLLAIWVGTTAGDLAYFTDANNRARLGIGAANKLLRSTGSAPEWVTLMSLTPMNATGDLLYAGSASTLAKLAIGSTGKILKVAAGLPSWAIDYKTIILKVIADNASLVTGDGQMMVTIPEQLDGMNLVGVGLAVYTVSSSGKPTVQIRNVTDGVDMLSTKVSVDTSEYSSYTAATPAVIDATHDDVAKGDRLAIDVDIAGTGTLGCEVHLKFALP